MRSNHATKGSLGVFPGVSLRASPLGDIAIYVGRIRQFQRVTGLSTPRGWD